MPHETLTVQAFCTEITIEVEYDIEPPEPQTRDHPGSPGYCAIERAFLPGDERDIYPLLTDEERKALDEELQRVLDAHADDGDYDGPDEPEQWEIDEAMDRVVP